ncbi:MAG: oligoribonuclease [Elusimicrobia bacterium]|nr:oligoribonuclease [Elusimicrobiota bacterium]
MATADDKNLIWLDLEMTGLEPERDVILEIATIVTDSELQILAEGPCLAIHQPDPVLDGMDPWCVEQHGRSGLTRRCRESSVGVLDAQARTLEFLAKWCVPGKSPLCGNTIGQDRRFLVKYMPRLHEFFHYRSIDVSSIKELVARWYPDSKYQYSKSKAHLSLEDVRESIAELVHYRKTVFR